VAFSLFLGAAMSFWVPPSRAETADPATLPAQPGAPAPTCQPRLGTPNTWEQLGDPIVLDGDAASTLKTSAYRSSIDPTRPCVIYRTAQDTRALERSTDGGQTFQRVFFDDRTSALGKPMHITGVYTPDANVVYLAEDGNGTAVVRSRDAGATWQPANGGLAGQAIRKLWFAASHPEVGYAAAQTGNALAFYATRNGGDQWTRLERANITNLLQGDDSYTVAIDPGDKAHVIIGFQGAASISGSDPPAGSLLLESSDYGQSFTPFRVPYQAAEILFARRAGNALRLYVIANGSRPETNKDNGVFYSDDQAGHWPESSWHVVPMYMRTTWWGGLVDPVTPDKVLYFGLPYYEAPSRLFAMYTRNGFKDQELAEQPEVKNANYGVTQYRADQFGQFYIDVGRNCRTNPCPGGVKDNGKSAWVTLRFRPPDPGQARVIGTEEKIEAARGGSYTAAHTCPVAPQPPLYTADGSDDSGSLAFDGTRLYYTRRGEQGPDPYAAVIRIADPTTCKETGRLVVHFDPATYEAARKRAISDYDGGTPLLPERPSVDSLSYDQVHDELWFSVTRTAPFVQPYNGDPDGSPFPVWAIPRNGSGVDRKAELRFWDNPCGLGGIGLLANDRARDTLLTCDRKIPGERTRAGRSLVTCLHPMFQGFTSGGRDVWDIRAWGVSRPGTLIALNAQHGNSIDQYDVRTCTHLDEWSPGVLANIRNPRQGPTFVSLQLACDPVSFRDRLAGAVAPPAVAWMRIGSTFTAYKVSPSEGPGLACPWPTVLRSSGDTGVDPGHQFQACMTVTVPNTGGTIPGVSVRISVAGAPAKTAVSDADGRACLPYDVPRTAAQGTRLTITGDVPEDVHLLASSAVGSVLIGQIPPPPPSPPPVILQPPKPVPPPIPLLLAPTPVPAPAAGVQPVVPAPGQVVAQQGLTAEKEKEVQLAHAHQESGGQETFAAEPAAESSDNYAFAAVVVGALILGASAFGMAVGRGGASLEPVFAYERSASRRSRRRRGMR
jgi:hypothetical protein